MLRLNLNAALISRGSARTLDERLKPNTRLPEEAVPSGTMKILLKPSFLPRVLER